MNLPVVQHHNISELISRFESFPVLSKEDEYDLAIRLKEYNDVDAAHRLVTSNLRNVVRIAMDYAGYGLPIEDIVQEGTIGLMVAVKKFDPYKGNRLMTYAVWWIKAMIHDYILKFYSQVKLGTTKLQKRLFYGLNKLSAEEAVVDGNITDRTQAISARLDADPQQVEEIITRLTYRDQSLDTPLAEDSDASFMDLLADSGSNPEDHVMEQERATLVNGQIHQAISTLSEREQDIVRQRLMADRPQTLEDLGRQYNISKERIRQIENNVKNKLRKALEGDVDEMTQ
ncbi:MAG TPA: RNA polymerase factor sigma-32 [Deltaproteobacteria bacterium]|nr:RNA polymerase factor sigma-32 [Deltaproteobacteria bacterium]HOI05787.1 RNA polymerase factor sigma-32 [Deltaproteobacteria bacterium]